MYFPVLLFTVICMFVESAMSLGIPHSIKLSPLGAFKSSYVLELAFYTVFVTATLFSIVGAFVLAIVRGSRAASLIDWFPRDATLHNAIHCLPLFLSPPSTVAEGAGQVATAHHIPTRSGGVAYPLSALRSGRWYQRQNSHSDTSIV